MATASTPSINHGLTSLSGITGGGGTTTTDLATVGEGAPATTTSLPIASGVTVNSPRVSLPTEGPTEDSLVTEIAVLTQSDTTLTAYAVPGTTGLAVLEGQTLSFRGEGVTLSDGNVVSLGFDGLVESTATGTYQSYPAGTGANATLMTSQSQSPSGGGSSAASTTADGAGSSGGASGSDATQASASASPSESGNAAASLSAGKAAMVLGAVAGMVAFGL